MRPRAASLSRSGSSALRWISGRELATAGLVSPAGAGLTFAGPMVRVGATPEDTSTTPTTAKTTATPSNLITLYSTAETTGAESLRKSGQSRKSWGRCLARTTRLRSLLAWLAPFRLPELKALDVELNRRRAAGCRDNPLHDQLLLRDGLVARVADFPVGRTTPEPRHAVVRQTFVLEFRADEGTNGV